MLLVVMLLGNIRKTILSGMPLLKSTQTIFIVLVGIAILKPASTEIVVAPKDAEAVVGANVVFQCSSSIPGADVQWNVYPVGKSMQVIYAYGKFNTPFADRFTVQNGHNLNISSINIDDAGTYECRDGFGKGEKQGAELIILESNPNCRSNTNLDKVVGKNQCGIEPGLVALSCSVQYQGNKPPTLEWKKNGDGKTITSGVSNEIRGNRILHNLTMKGDSIANGSSYNCRPAKAVSASATCNSETITILATSDSCQSYTAAIVCIIIIVMPIFNAITAIVIWYLYIRSPKEKKEKTDKGINLACCSKTSQEKNHEAEEALSKQNQDNEGGNSSSGKNLGAVSNKNSGGSGFRCKFSAEAIIFVVLMCIPFCIGLIALVFYRRRQWKTEKEQQLKEENMRLIDESKRQNKIDKLKKRIHELEKENEIMKRNSERDDGAEKQQEMASEPQHKHREPVEYMNTPDLAHKIETKAAASKGKSINGMGVLEKELFLLHKDSSDIEVYDSVTYQYLRSLQIPIIDKPYDLTTEKTEKCLFVIFMAKKIATQKGKESKKSNKQKTDTDGNTLPESLIGKLNSKGELLVPWPKSSGGLKGHLSVCESSLIVCLLEKNVINELSKDGELIHTVRLSPAADFKNPLHAIKLSDVHFAVSHGFEKNELRRISIVDREGNIVKECREWKKEKFDAPLHFVEDSGGSLLVADSGHHEILLLSSGLKYQRNLIDLETKYFPVRICFDESQKRLFVAISKERGSKGLKDGRVLIYNII